MRALWVAVFALPLLAGCLQGTGSGNDTPTGVPVGTMGLELVPLERPVSSATTWHEERYSEPRNEVSQPVDDGFVIENEWEPRDVDLTYHGVQPVYDEWGREVMAHVFRYEVMRLRITSFEFIGFTDVRITARWEPSLMEFAFDESTGRFLGGLDVDAQMRGFADHRWPTPFASDYMGDLMVPVAFQALAGDLSQPVADPFGETRLNRTDLKPLDGDCQPHEYIFTMAPWYKRWIEEMGGGDPEPQDPEDEWHHVVCLQDHGVPLWVFSGNASNNFQLTRRSAPGPLPLLEGEVLPPRVVVARPFEEVAMPLDLAKPILAPPTAYPGDWADQIRPVIQGVGTNVDYVQWQRDRPTVYVTDIDKAYPYLDTPLLPLLPFDPMPFESTSRVFIGDGDSAFWATVDSRYGTVEDPDIHISRQGFAFDNYPTIQRDAVASGEVQAAWETLLPVEASLLSFSSFPDFFGDLPPEYVEYLAPWLTTWLAYEFCFEEIAGGRFVDFSAVNGQMLALGGQLSTPEGCSAGLEDEEGFQRLGAGRDELWLRPATRDDPAVLVLPASGATFVLDADLDGSALARALAGSLPVA